MKHFPFDAISAFATISALAMALSVLVAAIIGAKGRVTGDCGVGMCNRVTYP